MSVIARRVASTPERTTSATWELITSLVCQDDAVATKEFEAVSGLAAACISEEVLRNDALVIVGQGPRLRVYCVHGDDAISGDNCNEDTLTWKPTGGQWSAYLPCTDEDFEWMKKAMPSKSTHFAVYSVTAGLPDNLKEKSDSAEEQAAAQTSNFDVGRFNEL